MGLKVVFRVVVVDVFRMLLVLLVGLVVLETPDALAETMIHETMIPP